MAAASFGTAATEAPIARIQTTLRVTLPMGACLYSLPVHQENHSADGEGKTISICTRPSQSVSLARRSIGATRQSGKIAIVQSGKIAIVGSEVGIRQPNPANETPCPKACL